VPVPITRDELEALVNAARGETIPLTKTTDTRSDSGIAIDEDAVGASWSLAKLAVLRGPMHASVGVGIGGALPAGPRQSTGDGNLAGTYTCEKCGEGNFDCGGCGADGYIFSDYGNRLSAKQIAEVLVRTGRVTERGAEVLAAFLDAEVYVLREPEART
jgi:hypothetical protein